MDSNLCVPRLQVDPGGVFVLPPAAVQELQLKVQPWRAGSRFLYVNGVDVEQRRLLAAWLVCLNVHQPVLSKVQDPAASTLSSFCCQQDFKCSAWVQP